MKTRNGSALIGILAALGCIVGLVAIIGIWGISVSNNEVRLRNAITAKQKDNQSELDNMQKKIGQAAQIPPAQMAALKDVIVGYAQARSGGGDKGGSFINAIHEAIPNVDQKTYLNLQNIITGSRDAFTMRQKETLDLKREHDNVRTTFPGSLICSGRPGIQVQIVTSTRAEAAFATGKDDDTKVFQ